MKHVVIIGSGPAGVKAALAAVKRGLRVTVIEQALTGGTCLNHGCIPTKLLLGGSAAVPAVDTLLGLRLGTGSVAPDFTALMMRKDRFIKGTRQALEKQCATAKIRLLRGSATAIVPNQVQVLLFQPQEVEEPCTDGMLTLHCDGVVVATGSCAAAFPGMEPDGQAVLDSTAMLQLSEAPKNLLIVGAGAIGLELGDFFHRMGSAITLIEAKDRLAPTEDPEMGQVLRKHYSRAGWAIHTGRKVAALTTHNDQASLTFEDGETLMADKALVAVGRQPTTHGMVWSQDVQRTGPGWLVTDEFLQAAPGLYAVGDVNGRTLLAHAAEHQAAYAIAHLCGEISTPYAPPAMPACIYGHMEVMRAGPTAEQLTAEGAPFTVSRSQLIANPMAQAYGVTAGLVKVCWVNDAVHGITAVGHGVTHLVTPAAIMVTQHWTAHEAAGIIYAHPSLDEALAQALHAPREQH